MRGVAKFQTKLLIKYSDLAKNVNKFNLKNYRFNYFEI